MSKKKGIEAEVLFMYECIRRGYTVALPYGDNAKYDLIVDIKGKLRRVQVKAIHAKNTTGDCYRLKQRGQHLKDAYTEKDIDILAIYVKDSNSWYLFKSDEIVTNAIQLYPHRHNPKGFYEFGHSRWEILKETHNEEN